MSIRLLKGGSIVPHFDENGLSHEPMMADANPEARLYECVLRAGATWEPVWISGEDSDVFLYRRRRIHRG